MNDASDRSVRVTVSATQLTDRTDLPGRDLLPLEATRLSRREIQIFQLIGSGHQNRHIAETLGVSVKTVETHKENIKAKLQLGSTRAVAEVARWWANRPGAKLAPP